jgi:8-oxo-dGTP pyrophosphatase MutT (NUDIX family)
MRHRRERRLICCSNDRGRWITEGHGGIPGGAIRDGESPEVTARREVAEEIAVLPSYRVTGVEIQDEIQDCGGGWKFHMLRGDVDEPFSAFCAQETDATGWFTVEEESPFTPWVSALARSAWMAEWGLKVNCKRPVSAVRSGFTLGTTPAVCANTLRPATVPAQPLRSLDTPA